MFCLLVNGASVMVTGQFAPTVTQGVIDSAKLEIVQLTAEWDNAIIKRDSLTLEKILAPGYSLNGAVNRSNWIINTLHHFTTDTLSVLGQQNITYYGQAMKSEASFFWKANYDGKPRINGTYLVTDIWIKQDGHWQVLIRLSSPSKSK